MSRHPGNRALRSWAAGGRNKLTAHIEECEGCQAVLDEMTRLNPRLRRALGRLSEPASGFLDRMESSLQLRHDRIDALAALGDLFSLPWRVIQAVVDDDGD